MKHIRSATVTTAVVLLCVAVRSSPLVARQASQGPTAATAPLRSTSTLLPGTRASALSTIDGSTVTSTNGSLADSLVRLRDARIGRIVSTMTSDKTGAFSFRAIDPGSYIVEVIGKDAAVIATSQLVSVNAGEVAVAVVRMPFQIPVFAGLLGQATQTAASETVVAAAASTGVLTSGPLDVCVSGPC